MFHRDSAGKAKFGGGTKPGAVKTSGSKAPPEHNQEQAPHGGSSEEHVTKTHPGETQPHPVTGVHAVSNHHLGGGKYKSHTHHDGGQVETKDHATHQDMQQNMDQALPDEQQEQQPGDEQGMSDMDLSGIGGEAPISQ